MQKKNSNGYTSTVVPVVVGILCVLLVVYIAVADRKKREEKQTVIQRVTLCAEENGLNDVSVELRKFEFEGKYWYKADVTCSNFGDFAPRTMLAIYDSLDSTAGGLKVGKTFASGGNIYSNGDTYVIYVSSNHILKNGEDYYDDYYNSQLYADVHSNKNSSSDENMKETTNSDKDSYGHNKYDAITIAEKEVKAKLKSPSTAKFSSSSETSVTRSGNTWRITGWVDAQNGFGATLRNSYTVKIEFASSDTYTIKECTVS
ncbi:hypothetical protein [Gemmiger sp.]